ncbi:hypothetical protein FACS1894142_3380 [Spirochaetia bacterium]|nr:hypothetical protein FACS1894142_3380 [Spirochaetia bacterium]
MTITPHRGATEIGGSCFEICTAKTRLVIDIGMPLANPDGSSFNSTETEKLTAQDLPKEKILPNIPALFNSKDDKETALLISHAHQDHYGLISFVDKKIPVYLGEASHKLIELTAAFAGKQAVIESPRYFKTYEPFTFGDMEITPYLMDHAAFDAYAFLIRAGEKSLLYTGDFRAHGRKWKLFYKFLHIAPKNVDYLLMEGTTLSRPRQKFKTEDQLEDQFVKTFKETKGINLVYLSGQNIDRLVTIFRACKKCGKLFVIDFYIANILTELAANSGVPCPSSNFPEIKVFFPSLLCKKIERLNRNDLIDRFRQYEITPEEIDEKARHIVMTVRSSMEFEIKRLKNISDGMLIYSMWEGYKENESTERFLTNLVKRGAAITTIHTSGHADYDTLQKLASTIQHKELIPIHTTEGSQYQTIFPESNVKQMHNGETRGDENDTQAGVKELTLFEHIEEIGKTHEKSGFLPDSGFDTFIDKVHPHIEYVCGKLQINEIQSALFADLVNLFDGYGTSMKDLAEFIGCKPIKLIKHLDEFKTLEEKNLILIDNSSDHFGKKRFLFYIELETLDALRKDSLPGTANKKLSLDEFFTEVAKICENRVQKEINYQRTIKNMNSLLENNRHLGIVQKIKSYGISPDDELMVLRFCHYLVDLDMDEMEYTILQRLYENVSDFRTAKQQLKSGTHVLQERGLIQNVNDNGFGDANAFCLTDRAKEELLFEIEEQQTKKPISGIKAVEEITAKKLFYPEKIDRQVTELTDLLRDENFAPVQKRLSEEGMRTGFACLFSGGPGTGKTETVYQIARETGRGIMQVDIADTKSMWFGESEKKIKEVFTRYRTAVKRSSLVPILLFNEADAVIGKRQNLSENRNGPGQTENTIQNIILQEIENLNGILIATTNLMQNMDKAFERRFLFKIEFEKPTLDMRVSIWQSLIPDITENDAQTLASKFEFSGGQIENIARRRTIAKLLYGENPALETMLQYCKEEHQEEQKTTIGFNAS